MLSKRVDTNLLCYLDASTKATHQFLTSLPALTVPSLEVGLT